MIIETYLPQFASKGFQPIIVHVGDQMVFGCDLDRDFGDQLPLLLDSDETLLNIYQQVGADSTLFPLAYLTNREDVIEFIYNDASQEDGETKSPATLVDDLQQLLDAE